MKHLWIFSLFLLLSCQSSKDTKAYPKENPMSEIITLAGGCFWCTEAVFQRLNGVDTVISGYMGGHTVNPTYKEVCTGTTNHAEVIQITFQPDIISVEELLEVFFTTHDPTTLNRQGEDVGTQYRSGIFYHTEHQKAIAEKTIADLEKAKIFEDPIVTEITPASTFYPAEDYHQNYFNLHGTQPFCALVIDPKVKKLQKYFQDKLK